MVWVLIAGAALSLVKFDELTLHLLCARLVVFKPLLKLFYLLRQLLDLVSVPGDELLPVGVATRICDFSVEVTDALLHRLFVHVDQLARYS